jgi:adenylate cyclase
LIIILLFLNFFIVLAIKYWKSDKDFDLLIYYIAGFMLLVAIGSFIFILISPRIFNHNRVFLPIGSVLLNNLIFLIAGSLYSIIEGKFKREMLDKLINLYIGEHIRRLKTNYSIDELSKRTSKKENATIFFSDLENFTKISEKLSPEETIKLINIYLEEMSQYIILKKGIIDKYI